MNIFDTGRKKNPDLFTLWLWVGGRGGVIENSIAGALSGPVCALRGRKIKQFFPPPSIDNNNNNMRII